MIQRLLLALLVVPLVATAQITDPVVGISDRNPNVQAYTNATLHVSADEQIERGTLLVKEGKVLAAGADVSWPSGTVVRDLKGQHIYPAFIDMDAHYGVPKDLGNHPQVKDRTAGAVAWNKALKPEFEAAAWFRPNAKEAARLRKMGFAVVASHHHVGIARGTSAVVSLEDAIARKVLLKAKGSVHFSFDKGERKREYPSSLMGTIALLRQTFYDLDWYRDARESVPVNLGLEAILDTEDLPRVFEVRDAQSGLRAQRLAREFEFPLIIRGSGDGYQQLGHLKSEDTRFILPLKFPDAIRTSGTFQDLDIPLEKLRHWELAPGNAARFQEAKAPFVLTASGLAQANRFWKNLRLAGQQGLTEAEAVRALTATPAQWLDIDHLCGDLQAGKRADFIILSDSLFHPKSKLIETHVGGTKYVIEAPKKFEVRGTYDLNLNSQVYELEVSGKGKALKGTVTLPGGAKAPARIQMKDRIVAVAFRSSDDPYRGPITLNGKINYDSGLWDGRGMVPDGSWVPWSAIRKKRFTPKVDSMEIDTAEILSRTTYPMSPFGWDSLPETTDLLITNATVWTCGEAGILRGTDVLLRNGKIAAIGVGLPVRRETEVIDGRGKHLTPGIVDEHSHIGISRGVNEGTQAISAEVRVGDVVRPNDINLYRQLSGGVTTSQLLHGSANPIGGQSALIKLKWGQPASEMLIPDAPGFIKFALGENVKRSNWGRRSNRYPQSRMGVEQIMYDAFYRAKAYRAKQDTTKGPFRIDLELEAVAEIMEEQRFITCHSYVQSEINMLMQVGDSMGFRINTFTHILEGYKVAKQMQRHGAAGSTFSDWWAYKFEVNDAIPYNGALMHEAGVLTAFNSDDAEMGRRLNQEAAKAVKYGGVSEEDALKFVTLNPAKMLHLDDRIGSVEEGKDADLVLWSAHPLSIYAQAEKTIIEGVVYYDAARDREMRKQAAVERLELLDKMGKAVKAGAKAKPHQPEHHHLYHCDTLEE